MSKTYNILKITILALVVAMTFSFVSAQFAPPPSSNEQAYLVPQSQPTSWSAPGCAAPNCNTPPPVNTGIANQTKLGSLILNANTPDAYRYGLGVFGISQFFDNIEIGTTAKPATVKITDGNQADGKVLTSDANGLASWKMLAGGGTTGISGSFVSGIVSTASSNIFTLPAGSWNLTVTASFNNFTNGSGYPVTLQLDGNTIGTLTPGVDGNSTMFAQASSVSGGSHTLTMNNSTSGGGSRITPLQYMWFAFK